MSALTLPLGLNLRVAGDMQRQILKALRSDGITYEVIAQSIELANASSLRSYVVSPRVPRRDNDTFSKVDASLRGAGFLSLKAPERALKEYVALFGDAPNSELSASENSENDFDFEFGVQAFQSRKNLSALSMAMHSAFHANHDTAIDALSALVDRYFMYRCSVDNDYFIKSFVKLVRSNVPHPHIRFTHVHPDRHSGLFLDNRPITTMGIVIKAGAAVHLIGNAENSGASNIITLSPYTRKPNILLGFTTVSSDRGLVSARVVLIRRPDSDKSSIGRFEIKDFNPEVERFHRCLLKGRGGFAADSTTIMPSDDGSDCFKSDGIGIRQYEAQTDFV